MLPILQVNFLTCAVENINRSANDLQKVYYRNIRGSWAQCINLNFMLQEGIVKFYIIGIFKTSKPSTASKTKFLSGIFSIIYDYFLQNTF